MFSHQITLYCNAFALRYVSFSHQIIMYMIFFGKFTQTSTLNTISHQQRVLIGTTMQWLIRTKKDDIEITKNFNWQQNDAMSALNL